MCRIVAPVATSAVCGIKADLCRPRASAPDCGSVHVTVEISPCAREQLGRPAAREREAEALAAALQVRTRLTSGRALHPQKRL